MESQTTSTVETSELPKTEVRMITADGVVSEELYKIIEFDSRKNQYILDGKGAQFRVHRARILPKDAYGKAVAILHNNKILGICPTCKGLKEVFEREINCSCSGLVQKFSILTNGELPKTNGRNAFSKVPKKKVSQAMENEMENTTTDAVKTNVIDIAEIKKSGELWEKDNVAFDHAKIEVRSYVLLADNPPRKLCFNTYGGTLGKRDVSSLELDAFRTNCSGSSGKKIGYDLKKDLDTERTKLEKSGYKQV